MILEARKNTPSTQKRPSKETKFFGLEKFATTELQRAIDSDQRDEHENQQPAELGTFGKFTTDENQAILQQNSEENKNIEIDQTPGLNLEMVLKRITVVNDANQSVISLEDISPEKESDVNHSVISLEDISPEKESGVKQSVLHSSNEIVILTDS